MSATGAGRSATRPPAYRWCCHKCASVSEARTLRCAQCGFAAIASAVEIARANGEPDPISEGHQTLGVVIAILVQLPP